MKENLIGIFDSGLGGLSVLKALMAMVPGVPAIFVADQRYCPYGTLSDQLILNRSRAICDWLTAQGATQIVVACNTATGVAIESLRSYCSVPVTGIEPAQTCRCANRYRENRRSGDSRNVADRKVPFPDRSLRQLRHPARRHAGGLGGRGG